jgi:alcohol dehydrogenase class IV
VGARSVPFFDTHDPRDDEIAAGRDRFRQSRHDGIVAVGGGSGMDGGKAIATVDTNDIGVPIDCAATIAEKAIQDSAAATNPRAATVAEI